VAERTRLHVTLGIDMGKTNTCANTTERQMAVVTEIYDNIIALYAVIHMHLNEEKSFVSII
jgi:molecular chaperone DnaK (HSP70)